MSNAPTIGVIGAGGWLGGAIVRSIVAAGLVQPRDLVLSYRSKKPDLCPEATWTQDNSLLAERSDVVLLSVRPADFKSVGASAPGRLVISVMAGVSISEISERMKTDRVIRSLPNAAAEVRSSYTPWIASAGCSYEDRAFASSVLGACGVEDEVTEEGQLDYFAGLTGTGPAYPALFAEAMMNDAISQGVTPAIARRAVRTLMIGSAKLMEQDDRDPSDIVQEFVEYKGMTAAAVIAMRGAPISSVIRKGVEAALERAKTLQNTS